MDNRMTWTPTLTGRTPRPSLSPDVLNAIEKNAPGLTPLHLTPDSSTPEGRALIIGMILTSPPDIFLFRHWHWLSSHPVPARKDLETNARYLKAHWQKLRRYAKIYKEPNAQS